MLNGSRPYRLAASVLVPTLVLLLGVGGVTLMQLCALGSLTATAQAPGESSDMLPCHAAMPDGGEESGHEAPAVPDGPAMQTCCFAVVAVQADHMAEADPERSLAPIVALLAPFASVPTPTPAPRDTGPLPLPVWSHLALSVLLI